MPAFARISVPSKLPLKIRAQINNALPTQTSLGSGQTISDQTARRKERNRGEIRERDLVREGLFEPRVAGVYRPLNRVGKLHQYAAPVKVLLEEHEHLLRRIIVLDARRKERGYINVTSEDSTFVDVPYVRFRKQLGSITSDVPAVADSTDLRKVLSDRESTVFVVNSTNFMSFLTSSDLPENLANLIGAR